MRTSKIKTRCNINLNETQSSDLLFSDVEKAAKITKEQRKSLRFDAFEATLSLSLLC